MGCEQCGEEYETVRAGNLPMVEERSDQALKDTITQSIKRRYETGGPAIDMYQPQQLVVDEGMRRGNSDCSLERNINLSWQFSCFLLTEHEDSSSTTVLI